MQEADIRPAELRLECERLFKLDTADFLRKHSNEFVEIDCPACACADRRLEFAKEGYEFQRCAKCRTVYISPRPPAPLLADYYANSRAAQFWQSHIWPLTKEARVENLYKPRADVIAQIVGEEGVGSATMIDVGAGSGYFGKEIADRRLFGKVILIEPGPIEVPATDEIELINDVVENVRLNEQADLATSFELLEHLFDPAAFLRAVFDLLRPGGFLVTTTPNFEGFELLTIGSRSINVAGPDHLNYFNPDSIGILLRRAGFSDVNVSTPGELDADLVRGRHLDGTIDLSDQRFLMHILIEHPDEHLGGFQRYLRGSGLSSHMLALGRK